ncbi:MAG: hypothetical protein HY925_15515 [Elusimicrobia bacterium]|nr:hypothetical protein [Elusimicrobiota bacterium]
MKRATLAALLSLGIAAAPGWSMDVFQNEKLNLNIYGRGQMIGVGQYVPDPYRDHLRVYLFMKQARLGVKGRYEDVKFDTQMAFGGENVNGSNTDLGLLDFVADIPLKPLGDDGWFKIGQFRVPYSREGLSDRGYMDYAERSIGTLGSYQARDYGLAIMKTKGNWTGTIGTFSSGGRDVPQRYLPERLGVPYMATRFGYNDGFDEDIYYVRAVETEAKRTVKAVMVNAIYMQDTLIGHSSALQARTVDKNLLIDAGFNPYINQGGGGGANGLGTIGTTRTLQRGNLFWLGADAAARKPLAGGKSVGGEVEVNWGGYQNRYGVIHLANARAQGDVQIANFGVGVRYSVLQMDKKSGFLSSAAGGTGTAAGANVAQRVNNNLGKPIHEITPSLTWRIKKGHTLKVVADMPITLNCPLWYDNMGNVAGARTPLGAYAFGDATGTTQNSLLATPGNTTGLKTVVQGRMLFQFQF